VATDKTAKSLTEFFNELNGILKPVPAPELARAKNYIALRFPSGFETTSNISRRLEPGIRALSLGTIKALTVDEVFGS
jgi:hypothetical protein